jgi:hypothetical protein
MDTAGMFWRQAVAAIVVVALAAPAAGAFEAQREHGYQDLRNPDSVGRAIEAQRVPQARVGERSADGFDWGDAAIGAGAVLGLLLIAMSVMLGVVHRRNRGITT